MTLETLLVVELTEHIGYEMYSPAGRNSGNRICSFPLKIDPHVSRKLTHIKITYTELNFSF